jgi:hypothetical protein
VNWACRISPKRSISPARPMPTKKDVPRTIGQVSSLLNRAWVQSTMTGSVETSCRPKGQGTSHCCSSNHGFLVWSLSAVVCRVNTFARPPVTSFEKPGYCCDF